MPSWKTHLFFSFIFTSASFMLLKYLSILKTNDFWILIFTPLIFLYSLLPDIDSDESAIRQALNVILLIVFVSLIVLYIIDKQVYYLVMMLSCIFIYLFLFSLKHRGQVHTVLSGAILSLPVLFINKYLALLCFAAFVSHILIDGEFKLF
jgi:hypothetical protein